jgi:hypothetical protein
MSYPPGGTGQQPWPAQPPGEMPGPVSGPAPASGPVSAQPSWSNPVPAQQSWPGHQSWPVPSQQSWPGPPQPWPGRPSPPNAGSAVASLVLGLVAMFSIVGTVGTVLVGIGFALPGPFAGVLALACGVAAVVTGIGARRQIAAGGAGGKGLATAGLVLGIVSISLIVVLVALVVVAITLEL